ncbi:hypothetical protein [Microcella sp.]|uniref:hypothetical protein n=1 Tax=Microcella sp. TaxID=1913979 RepID=UPI003F723A75
MLPLGAALLGTLTGCATAAEVGTAPEATGEAQQTETAVDARYRDGSYRADGPYQSPAGGESIIVVLQLENDIVTDVEIGLYPTSATSSTYQAEFAGGIGDLVIGHDIDSLDVTVVAGSSLTSTGFRAALATIKAEAVES